jgi:hypothetical protein
VTISPLFCDIIAQSLSQRMPLDIIDRINTRIGLEQRLAALDPDLILISPPSRILTLLKRQQPLNPMSILRWMVRVCLSGYLSSKKRSVRSTPPR